MKGMSLIVKKVAQLMTGFIFLYGIYIMVHGHLTPGGGFAGGAILAGAYILQILAFGRDPLHLKKKETGASLSESIAILLVLMMAVAGFFIGWMSRFIIFDYALSESMVQAIQRELVTKL